MQEQRRHYKYEVEPQTSGKNPTDTAPFRCKDSTVVSMRLDLGNDHYPAGISRVGLAVSAGLSLAMISALSICLKRRVQATKDWKKAPWTTWAILVIYVDSIVFILGTAILIFGVGVNSGIQTCSSAILLCLICYMSTKFIYFYLVEKVYFTRKLQQPRLKSKLYCFNCFGILLPYCLILILNFIYRSYYFTTEGTCLVAIKVQPLIAFIALDAALNLYLTVIFVVPLRNIWAHSQARNPLLRTIVFRSLLSCLLTLITTTTNLTILLVLHGEPAWIFLLSCNIDVVLSVLVRRWVILKGLSGIITSRHPQDIMVNESIFPPPSFSSFQTADNMGLETNNPQLGFDGNGKSPEITLETPSSSMAEHVDAPSDSALFVFSPTNTQPPHYKTTQYPVANSIPDICENQEEEEDRVEVAERAIITTQISAQKMHDLDRKKEFRTSYGKDEDSEGEGKLGGIRVVVEQVVEVEIMLLHGNEHRPRHENK